MEQPRRPDRRRRGTPWGAGSRLAGTPALGLALAAAILANCHREPQPAWEARIDLVARFPQARAAAETAVIEFGTEGSGPHLAGGWSRPRHDERRDRPYAASNRRVSSVRFYLMQPRDLAVRIACRPEGLPEPARVEMEVFLNRRPLERLTLDRRLAKYRLELPAAQLETGENLLSFQFVRLPEAPPGERRHRPPVVFFYRLGFGAERPPSPAPSVETDRRRLILPPGSEVSYFEELPAESRLIAERLRFRGGGRLEVWLEDDQFGKRMAAALVPGGGADAPEVRLADHRPLLARLTLRNVATGEAAEGDAAVLETPVILAQRRSEPPPPAPRPPASRPDILVYMIDTLRTDHLGLYGYPRPVSPQLDAFAAGATVFDNAIGQSSWTRSSVASLFTGLWPGSHGTFRRGDRLPEAAVTLAEVLRESGYRTAGIVSNANVYRNFGFDQGFDTYAQLKAKKPTSTEVNQRTFAWLDGFDGSAPFFLFVLTVDPHHPYLPPEPYMSRFAPGSEELAATIRRQKRREIWKAEQRDGLLALYDAEIAYNDATFGELLADLERRGLLDEMLVVVLSDHGEEFLEHGRWTHGKNLHTETLDIPLIVKLPGQRRGRRVTELAQHTDLMPTLLEAAGIEPPPGLEGRSLLPALAGDPAGEAEGRRVFSHLELDGPLHMSLVNPDWKLIAARRSHGRGERLMLYDRRRDPGETRDLSLDRPVTATVLRQQLEDWLLSPASRLEADQAVIDPELEETLRALGYLQ